MACDCEFCAKCGGKTICAKCRMCARCHQHAPGCPGCTPDNHSGVATLFQQLGEHFFFYHRHLETLKDATNQQHCKRCKELTTALDKAIKQLPEHV